MKIASLIWTVFTIASFLFVTPVSSSEKFIKMSTTTSTQTSGLLDILLPAFKVDSGITVKVIAKGTGAAIRDGIDGNVDIIFVHAKKREEKFIKDGYGTKRYGVMHNDFVLVGPRTDPAETKKTGSVVEALKKIASSKSQFISRGDDSGTHTREQFLWSETGLTMAQTTDTILKKGINKQVSFSHPKGLGRWYLSIGQGMGKTLIFADEKKAYTLTDRGTYLKYKLGHDVLIALEILYEGDKALKNPYGIIPVNPKTHPHVNYESATVLAKWLVSEKGQHLIGDYKLLGNQLFFPDTLPL